ncbi:MAG: VOC family protein [Reyranella sp.]|nr:VOC family protein [Reyranella sp.]
MLAALDHLVVGGSAALYETLLGRQAVNGSLRTGNVGVRFVPRVSGLRSMVFATQDPEKAATLLERRAVPTTRTPDGLALLGHGVAIEVIARTDETASPLTTAAASAVSGLDHVVVRTPNPERAIAFYAGRLGLDLRLDRSNPKWGARLLFFRCGDLVIEIAHDLKKGVSDEPDHLWGLSWRVPDIAAAQARLKAAGLDVTEPRDGRRPGSQVCTVKDGTGGVPTILIGGVGRWQGG